MGETEKVDEVRRLFEEHGWTVEEIARHLELPLDTVRSWTGELTQGPRRSRPPVQEVWLFMICRDGQEELITVSHDGRMLVCIAFDEARHDALWPIVEHVARNTREPVIVRHFKATGIDVGIIGV